MTTHSYSYYYYHSLHISYISQVSGIKIDSSKLVRIFPNSFLWLNSFIANLLFHHPVNGERRGEPNPSQLENAVLDCVLFIPAGIVTSSASRLAG